MLRKIKDYIKYQKRKKQLKRIEKNFHKNMANQIDLDPEVQDVINRRFWDLL